MNRWSRPWIAVAVLLGACGGSEPPAPEAAPVASPAQGARHDPPVPVSEVPDGAWMCDMGTVHYTAPHAGDCPVCGMALVQKQSAVGTP